jgi:hypothetical protein
MSCVTEQTVFRIFGTSVLLGVVAALATPAFAISLTNRDDRAYKVQIIEGESKSEQALAPGGVLEGVCLAGCIIRLDDNETEEYELEGPEVVSIESGDLYYDGPDSPAESPQTSEPARPSAPKK